MYKKWSLILLLCFILPIFHAEPTLNRQQTDDIGQGSQLPSSFSWRDIDGVDFVTPIRNQRPFHSCETFAIVGALEAMVQIEVGYPFNCDLSEAHLYFFSGGNTNWGSYPENDTQFLQDYGIPDESCWPYPSEVQQYPLNTTCPDWMNRTVKIRSWRYLPEDPIAIKEALVTNGPVPSYFIVYQDFLYHTEGIYQHRWGRYLGPHYMTIVGYNDDPGYWMVKNSWGTNYQEEGWVRIKYGECSIEKKSLYLEGVYGHFPLNQSVTQDDEPCTCTHETSTMTMQQKYDEDMVTSLLDSKDYPPEATASHGGTLYVDDDNVNGPWDGSEEHPYLSIQQGINHASDGWTVHVNKGTYYEHININKSITLEGEDRENTCIDGGYTGHVVQISTSYVNLSGFTICNSGKNPFEAGVKTLILYPFATIKDNIIEHNEIGIFLNYGYDNAIPWNNVCHNIIQNNSDGMYLHWSNNNIITGNIITSNRRNGIELESSRNCHITGNTLKRNGNYGLYLRSASHNTLISNNNFLENHHNAYFDGSLSCTWSGNYWSDWKGLILQPIKGQLDISDIPLLNFDFSPSKHPIET